MRKILVVNIKCGFNTNAENILAWHYWLFVIGCKIFNKLLFTLTFITCMLWTSDTLLCADSLRYNMPLALQCNFDAYRIQWKVWKAKDCRRMPWVVNINFTKVNMIPRESIAVHCNLLHTVETFTFKKHEVFFYVTLWPINIDLRYLSYTILNYNDRFTVKMKIVSHEGKTWVNIFSSLTLIESEDTYHGVKCTCCVYVYM